MIRPFRRIDYQMPPRTFRMDNASCAGQLVATGRQIAEPNENQGEVKEFVLDGQPVEPFRPWSDERASGTEEGLSGANRAGTPAMDGQSYEDHW